MYYIVLYLTIVSFDGSIHTFKHYIEPVSYSAEGCMFVIKQLVPPGDVTYRANARFLCEKRISSIVDEE